MKKINYDNLAYFFYEKDLERMCNWEEQLKLIRKEHPEVAAAYDNLQVAKKTFKVMFENMLENVNYD